MSRAGHLGNVVKIGSAAFLLIEYGAGMSRMGLMVMVAVGLSLAIHRWALKRILVIGMELMSRWMIALGMNTGVLRPIWGDFDLCLHNRRGIVRNMVHLVARC